MKADPYKWRISFEGREEGSIGAFRELYIYEKGAKKPTDMQAIKLLNSVGYELNHIISIEKRL